MASCAYCGTRIFLGGKKVGDRRFCSEDCYQKRIYLDVVDQVPADLLEKYILSIHTGTCPKCGREGPVDVHNSYKVWSALVMTSWSTTPIVSCRRCGMKSKLGNTAFSLIFGWWGFPWGFIMTPIQVGRNVLSLTSTPDPTRPSKKLRQILKFQLAANILNHQNSERN